MVKPLDSSTRGHCLTLHSSRSSKRWHSAKSSNDPILMTNKGLIISTGGFTLEARREATRDGAPPIDLIDGQLLADKLKELKLGVKTNLVEHVEVIDDWFRSI